MAIKRFQNRLIVGAGFVLLATIATTMNSKHATPAYAEKEACANA